MPSSKRLLDMRALYRVILNDEHVTDAAVTTLKEFGAIQKTGRSRPV